MWTFRKISPRRITVLFVGWSATHEAVDLPGVNKLDGDFSWEGGGVPHLWFQLSATGPITSIGSTVGKAGALIARLRASVAKNGRFSGPVVYL